MNLLPNLKGKKVKIKETSTHLQVPDFGGSEILIEGLWEDIAGKSWISCEGNPTCIIYHLRAVDNQLPIDNAVYYGKIDNFGHLVHISELELET